MKNLVFVLIILFSSQCFSQSNKEKLKSIKDYADSIDNAINNSIGYPGEIFCNTVNMKRNERAIGMQETKISFYFWQKDDSVIENGNEIRFYQVYNRPLKIKVEYNIAASQNVVVCYYYSGKSIYYIYKTEGEYGNEESRYSFYNFDLIYTGRSDKENNNQLTDRFTDFTKKETIDSGKIITNSAEYEKLYFLIFSAGQLDK